MNRFQLLEIGTDFAIFLLLRSKKEWHSTLKPRKVQLAEKNDANKG